MLPVAPVAAARSEAAQGGAVVKTLTRDIYRYDTAYRSRRSMVRDTNSRYIIFRENQRLDVHQLLDNLGIKEYRVRSRAISLCDFAESILPEELLSEQYLARKEAYDVPHQVEPTGWCLPACVATVSAYWEQPMASEDIVRQLDTRLVAHRPALSYI